MCQALWQSWGYVSEQEESGPRSHSVHLFVCVCVFSHLHVCVYWGCVADIENNCKCDESHGGAARDAMGYITVELSN